MQYTYYCDSSAYNFCFVACKQIQNHVVITEKLKEWGIMIDHDSIAKSPSLKFSCSSLLTLAAMHSGVGRGGLTGLEPPLLCFINSNLAECVVTRMMSFNGNVGRAIYCACLLLMKK